MSNSERGSCFGPAVIMWRLIVTFWCVTLRRVTLLCSCDVRRRHETEEGQFNETNLKKAKKLKILKTWFCRVLRAVVMNRRQCYKTSFFRISVKRIFSPYLCTISIIWNSVFLFCGIISPFFSIFFSVSPFFRILFYVHQMIRFPWNGNTEKMFAIHVGFM